MSTHLRPARAVPPGRIIRRELEARGWTQNDLASVMDRPAQAISEIIRARKQITPDTACQLAAAFGTSPQLWLNLEANYRLHLACQDQQDDDIARRSRLYSIAPISEMMNNGWIPETDSVDTLERHLCVFLGIDSLDQHPQMAVNLRQTADREPELAAQIVWVKRVENLACAHHLPPFDLERAKAALPDLLALAQREEDVAQVPPLLHSLGIHLAIVPHLSHTYLDGAALALGDRPVIALTLRYDRIDSFWFTLLHELAHILAQHPGPHLDNFDEPNGDQVEAEANQMARDWLVDPKAFADFVAVTQPYFSKTNIKSFASSQQRHPGIVLGRLQFYGLVPYRNLRTLLAKVNPFLKDWIDLPVPAQARQRASRWSLKRQGRTRCTQADSQS